jgi:hypothetical protein
MDKSLESAETSPVYLRTCIVEPILITCLKERSFYDIYNSIQDIEAISERILRKYLYHLINEGFLKYHAETKVFVTSPWGADLLVLIYNQIQQNQTCYLDLKIKVG